MSIDGSSVDTDEIYHLNTADDLRARAASLGMDTGETIEIDGMASFFLDIPPEISSSLYPKDFVAGREMPDAANSYAQISGIYSNGRIALAAKDEYIQNNPEQQFKPDPSASLSKPFESASNIASLIEEPGNTYNGPKAPGEV